MTDDAPQHVVELAQARQRARASEDRAAADDLRDKIADEGWAVHDTATGFELSARPAYPVLATLTELGPRSDEGGGTAVTGLNPTGEPSMAASQALWDGATATSRIDLTIPKGSVTVSLIADGWPADLRACVEALLAHTDVRITVLDLGDVDGVGAVVHELARANPDRITEYHVAQRPHWRDGDAGWGQARNALLRADASEFHVVLETSTILEGDAITPLIEALREDPDVVAAGWRGVDPTPGGNDWQEAGPGDVTALLGYLFAVRRAGVSFPEQARFYRHGDLEFFVGLPGRKVVPAKDLPVRQERHRGYLDVDEEYRDRESRQTYKRVLQALRQA